MRQFDYFCITENGFFFSHAGISDSALISLINKEIDLFNLNSKSKDVIERIFAKMLDGSCVILSSVIIFSFIFTLFSYPKD